MSSTKPERTVVVLPSRLKQRAEVRARKQKVSLDEIIRQALVKELANPVPKRTGKRDPLFDNVPVYDGPVPADFSINHDKYLYDEES